LKIIFPKMPRAVLENVELDVVPVLLAYMDESGMSPSESLYKMRDTMLYCIDLPWSNTRIMIPISPLDENMQYGGLYAYYYFSPINYSTGSEEIMELFHPASPLDILVSTITWGWPYYGKTKVEDRDVAWVHKLFRTCYEKLIRSLLPKKGGLEIAESFLRERLAMVGPARTACYELGPVLSYDKTSKDVRRVNVARLDNLVKKLERAGLEVYLAPLPLDELFERVALIVKSPRDVRGLVLIARPPRGTVEATRHVLKPSGEIAELGEDVLLEIKKLLSNLVGK